MTKRIFVLYIIILLLVYCPIAYADSSSVATDNDETSWTVSEDGTLTITGKGPIPNSYTPWMYNGDNHIGGANITKLIVGEGITRIGDYVTQGLGNLQSVSLPSTLKQIGGQNFKRMSDLSEIVFPDGLEEIDYCCFQYCDSLVSVSIPASVTELGWGSFAFCTSLKNIFVDPGNSSYFSDNGVLKRTQYNSTKLCCYPAGRSATNYIIAEDVNSMGEYAFGGAKNLEEVSFPSSMRSINMGAFSECDNIRRIVLPENLTSISAYAFSSCSKVEAVLIPDSVTRISAPAFSRNTIMICLEGSAAEQYAQQNGSRFIYKNDFYINRIPAGCTVIDDDAFFDSNIKCIYIHSNVSSIGNSAFPESTTIICNHGSFAESWANGAGYRIIHIEDFE